MKVLRSLFLLVGLSTLAACAAQPDRGVAPVPAAPALAEKPIAPARMVKKSFSVYFDTNKADIRAAAMQILYEAAQTAKPLASLTIRVQGYTDAAGKAAHNKRLSERRAAAVADQLRKLGLTVAIETTGHGEVAADQGRRKNSKENRRVDITFEGAEVADAAAPDSARLSLDPHSDRAVAADAAAGAPHASGMPQGDLMPRQPAAVANAAVERSAHPFKGHRPQSSRAPPPPPLT